MPYLQLGFLNARSIIAKCQLYEQELDNKDKKPLSVEDLPALEDGFKCRELLHQFDRTGGLGGQSSLLTAVLKVVIRPFVLCLFLSVIRSSAFFLQVYALGEILSFVGTSDGGGYALWQQIVLVALIGLGAFVVSLCQHNIFNISWGSGLKARSLVCGLILRKTLTQAPMFLSMASPGKQTNLLASDSNAMIEWLWLFIFLWVPVIESAAAIAWIGVELGWAAAATAGVTLLLFAFQLLVGNLITSYRSGQFKIADERLKQLTEFFGNIAVVKMNSWETCLFDRVASLRGREGLFLRKGNTIKLLNASFQFLIPGLLALTTFGVQNIYSSEMSPRSTFTVLALLGIIARAFAFVPRSVATFASAIAALNRIEQFLRLDFETDVPKNSTEGAYQQLLPCVSISGSYGWGHDSFRLKGLNFQLRKGSFTVVVGPVGSGKSTLLYTLMRGCRELGDRTTNRDKDLGAISNEPFVVERKKEEEKPSISHLFINPDLSVAYVAQEPWIASGTIRDNILFGQELDLERYFEVLEACALGRDVEQWGGDLVEVGEKGISLSGGQKQRICMARAHYSPAELVLLDDPLSAVDAVVGKHLLEHCILGMKRQGRTILEVSHHPLPLTQADQVIALDSSGRQMFCGSSEEVPLSCMPTAGGGEKGRNREASEEVNVDQEERTEVQEEWKQLIGKGRQLIVKEVSVEGSVTAGVYGRFASEGGVCTLLIFAFFYLVAQGSRNASEWWFAAWTAREYPDLSNRDYVLIELALVLVTILFGVLRCVVFAQFGMKASSSFHNRMFQSVLFSPLHFFESVPLGRIMNRFSKDVDYCDDGVPRAIFEFLQPVGTTVGSLALLVVVFPWFLIAVVVCVLVFIYFVRLYLPTARQVKRLEGVSRSPTHQLFQQILTGLPTLKAFHRLPALEVQFHETIDTTTRTLMVTDLSQRWIGIRMDWGVIVWILTVGTLCIVFQEEVSRSLAGLALSQSLTMTYNLQIAVRNAALTESMMTSVERLDEYGSLPREHDADGGNDVPSTFSQEEGEEWPRSGSITTRSLSAAYPSAPTTHVLSELSVEIQSGEKVAVVGRTGAGKSTLLSCFFRLIPNISPAENAILIDGKSIHTIPNGVLRSRLGVIPQTSAIFSGSLRSNIDPFQQFADQEIVDVLARVQLSDLLGDSSTTVSTTSVGLQRLISESSLSVGQKQLLCAARALLKKPKILFMDEATANVDGETDEKIQNMIQLHCEGVTVITIAHRLNTVLHYDKVMVLDKGKLVEYDSPSELSKKAGGVFSSMLEAAGLTI